MRAAVFEPRFTWEKCIVRDWELLGTLRAVADRAKGWEAEGAI